ncbi:hypothetical protein [Chitinophaga caseinilytica]|uniref:hypothetical protein n=1 Tax=Chitinophaga caseinilytica TaxID=2267521 RepID=UPI003C2DDB24
MRMVRYYLPAMGWIILIICIVHPPGKGDPNVRFPGDAAFRQGGAFFPFGGMVLLLAYGYYRHHGRIGAGMLTLIVTCVSAYGLAIEFIQKYLVANRSFRPVGFCRGYGGRHCGALIFRSWGGGF